MQDFITKVCGIKKKVVILQSFVIAHMNARYAIVFWALSLVGSLMAAENLVGGMTITQESPKNNLRITQESPKNHLRNTHRSPVEDAQRKADQEVDWNAERNAVRSVQQETERNASREEFREAKLGIFLHWGIYALYGQGEWVMAEQKLQRDEYAKAAGAFYPAGFDASEWVRQIKASGAKYICFTTRHHDGFSMWKTRQSDYNIVDATPFGRDVLRELADACHEQGIRLHLYYSLVDWGRDDYPMGESCRENGKDPQGGDYMHYLAFMKAQLTELLTEYGEIGAIWFDGEWDHAKDSVPFDWHYNELYDLIHRLQPGCLVGNNHHHLPQAGEDIEIFERDVPGENEGGYSEGQEISDALPLETCQTMNWSWGYKVSDVWYKSAEDLQALLRSANEKGANLLLNIGPRPDGKLPETAVERLSKL